MASFINVFTKYLSKTWRKRCHILTQNFKIHFNMYVLLRHHVFLYLKFYVLFCFCHHSLFNVSFLHLFINVSRGISQKLGEKGVISQHKIPKFSSTCMYLYITMCDVFLYLTFIYLSIPSSLLAERTANTWEILLYNDRKSRHRRIKTQRRHERLSCNTSLVISVGYERVRQRPGGWVPRCTFKNIYWKLIAPS